MLSSLPAGTLLILGSLVISLLPRTLRRYAMVALPVLSAVTMLVTQPLGTLTSFDWFDLNLHPVRMDPLSWLWAWLFHFAALVVAIYAWQQDNRWQSSAATMYAGSAIAAVVAGDLLSLFVAWELTAVSSVLLVWGGAKNAGNVAAGIRYLLWQVGSGVLLLAGILMHFSAHHSLDFGRLDEFGVISTTDWSGRLILLAIGIKAAFPLLHTWLPDAYPRASVYGTVYLSSFTTKMAIYALARAFAGTELLIGIGAVMAVFPLVFAAVEDDLRKVLSHVLNNQLGFMVVAIGIGSPLALDGAAAMAVAHVMYKSLLFMAVGAVMLRTGTACASQLGGLRHRMPWTFAFCTLAAMAACPPLCAFVTKSLVLSAVAEQYEHSHMATWNYVWLALLVGAIGAFLAAFKVVVSAFCGEQSQAASELQVRNEAPLSMLLAMGMSAIACLAIGIWPNLLYRQLPHHSTYHPYSTDHILTQLQLLTSAAFTWSLASRFGWWPNTMRATILDVNWLWRKPVRGMLCSVEKLLARGHRVTKANTQFVAQILGTRCEQWHCELGPLGRTVSSDRMVLSATLLLLIYLWMFYR